MKNTALLILYFTVLFGAQAGEFDSLYDAQNRLNSEELMKRWEDRFPGLKEKLLNAAEDARKTGIYQLITNESPVAWNVSAKDDIYVNSINSGYFMSLREPDLSLLFPGLTTTDQSISVTAGNDLIVVPVSTSEGGFGTAVVAEMGTQADLSAGNRIILMSPSDVNGFNYYDDNSIFVGEDSKLRLNASEIFILGSITSNYGSVINLQASQGIYLITPPANGSFAAENIQLQLSEMNLDAPTILVERNVSVGLLLFGQKHPSVLTIGANKANGIQTKDVYFEKNVTVETESLLNVNALQSIVFADNLNVVNGGQAKIESKDIVIRGLFLDNSGASADFRTAEGGSLRISDRVTVGGNSKLKVDIADRGALRASFITDGKGTTIINLGSNAYWQSQQDSSVSNLILKQNSFVELGGRGSDLTISTKQLNGNGGIFRLVSGARGSIHITESSEGNHQVLLASSGKSIQDTGYMYHIVAADSSPSGEDNATFSLANKGVVDIGPYEYKFGLIQYGDKSTRDWVIISQVTERPEPDLPAMPDNPDLPTPSLPGSSDSPELIPKPDLKPLPFDPSNPPIVPPEEVKPIGLSASAKMVLAGVNSGAQVIQYLGSLDDMRARMGEVRDGADAGPYVLYRYNRSRLNSYPGISSRVRFSTYSLGLDSKVTPNWIVGGSVVFTDGDIKLSDGFGSKTDSNSAGIKLYGTWYNTAGTYADTVLTFNHHSTRIHAKMRDELSSHANYSNIGIGLSQEVGHRFIFPTSSETREWFVEPQAQLSFYFMDGKRFAMSNGMSVKLRSNNSLNGRLGVVAGQKFSGKEGKGAGQVYVRAGVDHEFLGKTKMDMNEFSFEDRSIGTRVYYGLGGEAVVNESFKVFGQVNREHGSRMKTDFQVKIGLKYIF